MTKADDYRRRASELDKAIKARSGIAEKTRLRMKQKALRDMAENEDWLDGKPAPKTEAPR